VQRLVQESLLPTVDSLARSEQRLTHDGDETFCYIINFLFFEDIEIQKLKVSRVLSATQQIVFLPSEPNTSVYDQIYV